MTRDDVIEQADARSERKGKQFDLKAIYSSRLSKLCRRYRYWWRHCYAIFNVVPGTVLYDLTALTAGAPNNLTPATAFTEIGVEEIVTFQRVDNATSNPPQVGDLNPIVNTTGFIEMALNVTQGPPARYVMNYGDYKTLRLDPLDNTYQLVLTFWGIPNVGKDSASTVVPLVPPWYHDVIVDGMIADIFASAYGEQNAKTLKAIKDYELGIEDMIMRPSFTGKVDSQLVSREEAIRSTGTIVSPQWGPMNIPPST